MSERASRGDDLNLRRSTPSGPAEELSGGGDVGNRAQSADALDRPDGRGRWGAQEMLVGRAIMAFVHPEARSGLAPPGGWRTHFGTGWRRFAEAGVRLRLRSSREGEETRAMNSGVPRTVKAVSTSQLIRLDTEAIECGLNRNPSARWLVAIANLAAVHYLWPVLVHPAAHRPEFSPPTRPAPRRITQPVQPAPRLSVSLPGHRPAIRPCKAFAARQDTAAA